MTDDASVALRVKKIMVETLELHVSAEQLDDRLPLRSSTVQLDSLSILQLIVALEDEFGRQIDDQDVLQASLEDVRSLVDLVKDRLAS